jgi:glutathione S-transferase
MEPLEVYVLPGCPYCKKVTRVLDRMELPYETTQVPRAHGKRGEVEELSGQTNVPVLVDPNTDVHGMPESSDIVDYLRETYEYPAGVEPRDGIVSRVLSFLPRV